MIKHNIRPGSSNSQAHHITVVVQVRSSSIAVASKWIFEEKNISKNNKISNLLIMNAKNFNNSQKSFYQHINDKTLAKVQISLLLKFPINLWGKRKKIWKNIFLSLLSFYRLIDLNIYDRDDVNNFSGKLDCQWYTWFHSSNNSMRAHISRMISSYASAESVKLGNS